MKTKYDCINDIRPVLGGFDKEFDIYAIVDDAYEYRDGEFVLTVDNDELMDIIAMHAAVATTWNVETFAYRLKGGRKDEYGHDGTTYHDEEEARRAYEEEVERLPQRWRTEKACGHLGDFGYGVALIEQWWGEDGDGLYAIDDSTCYLECETYDGGDEPVNQ